MSTTPSTDDPDRYLTDTEQKANRKAAKKAAKQAAKDKASRERQMGARRRR